MAHTLRKLVQVAVPCRPLSSLCTSSPSIRQSCCQATTTNSSARSLGEVALNRLSVDCWASLTCSSNSSYSWNARLFHRHVAPRCTKIFTDRSRSSASFCSSGSSSGMVEVDVGSMDSPLNDELGFPEEALGALREAGREEDDTLAAAECSEGSALKSGKRFKPTCYYFTQGLCTMMDETEHTDKFSHAYPDFLKVKSSDLKRVKKQPFEYYLVLDLEGMVEILEFPVVMINSQTLEVVDRFHRFVRPVKMTEERQTEYIKGKYGKWGLDRVWHDTAIPFTEVLKSFEGWLESHSLYDSSKPNKLTRAAFVTCGNWDVKTKIPEQCRDSDIPLSPYFNEWINLKDVYLYHYRQRAGGMLAMLRGLKLPLAGTHHVGLDDAHNITRILQRMLIHGAYIKISAKRKADDPKGVKWMFRYRVK